MNVYDEAHNLAKAIKESNEFQEFTKYSQEVEKDTELKKMIDEIRSISFEMQQAQIMGQEPDPELANRMQTVYTMAAVKPLATQFIQAETRMSLMMKDVFEILGEAIGPMVP